VSAYSNIATATTLTADETVTLVTIQDIGVNKILVPNFRLWRKDEIGINTILGRVRLERIDSIDVLGNDPFSGTSLLDDFNRSDTLNEDYTNNPLGLSWDDRGLYSRMLIISGMTVTDHKYGTSCWNVWLASYAPDSAISIMIVNWGFGTSGSTKLGFTDTYDGGSTPGWWLTDYGTYITASNIKDGNGYVQLSLTVPGVSSGSYYITNPQNGDEIGIAIIDGVVTVGYKAVGGSWVNVMTSAAPSPYPFGTTMYPWIMMNGEVMHLDNFCGGVVS
jgi:hypothetical protein